MKKVIISGCCGAMGQAVVDILEKTDDFLTVAGFDIFDNGKCPFTVYSSIIDIPLSADVIIDFSNPAALRDLLGFAVNKRIPVVLATTGHSTEQLIEIENAAKYIPIFRSANMSLGINIIIDLVKKAAKTLGDSFDIEIVEKHHNKKVDAPSGTALMIADEIKSVLDFDANYVYDRHSERKGRDKNEIGLHSVRGGTIVGEHDVIFAGDDEVITISHSAQSKKIFARGAIKAASFIVGKKAGIYTMKDLIAENV